MADRRIWSWRQAFAESDLPPTTRLVLHTIALFMNAVGSSCYPTTKTLAKYSGLSEKSVITHLRLAREQGWIKVEPHGFKGQKWANHQYEAAWPDPPEIDTRADEKGTEGGSVPLVEGTEPDDGKALKEVQCNTPYTSPIPVPRASAREAANGSVDRSHVLQLLYEAAGKAAKRTSRHIEDIDVVATWIEKGADLYADIYPAIRVRCETLSPHQVRSWSYFDKVIDKWLRAKAAGRISKDDLAKGATPRDYDDRNWIRRIELLQERKKDWLHCWGPPPGEPGSFVPEHLAERWTG